MVFIKAVLRATEDKESDVFSQVRKESAAEVALKKFLADLAAAHPDRDFYIDEIKYV
ncbi:hypothetical protein ACSFM0_001279 [Escherichia coli]|uniref:hypothetical protein n=1 Tax=Escherichia coli TaxID=562 RepID=UPI0012FFBE45|nr:hypothetical protein [Escherichia coli]EES8118155.1 hypothetical protein [Escherichia coli]EFF9100762.1 hypothetical protein [Escherichia coli]EHK6137193.1 hypothetical protein [Escherichia coli]EHW6699254.1 hypothetical protein [Escherichia coli]EIN0392066.1 hypothetical protein [Escherichia coli]